MKALLTLFVLLELSILVDAQQKFPDVLYLKNGSVIQGKISDQIGSNTVEIETDSNKIDFYPRYEIERISIMPPASVPKEEGHINRSKGIKLVVLGSVMLCTAPIWIFPAFVGAGTEAVTTLIFFAGEAVPVIGGTVVLPHGIRELKKSKANTIPKPMANSNLAIPDTSSLESKPILAPNQPIQSRTISKSGLTKGIQFIVQGGYGFPHKTDSKTAIGTSVTQIDAIVGYRFNPYFAIGGGTGLHYYSNIPPYKETLSVPLLFDCRVNLLNSRISPYLWCSSGLNFKINNSFDGMGFINNFGFGLNIRSAQESAINIGIFYSQQDYDAPTSTPQKTVVEQVGSLGVMIGFTF